MLRVLFLAFATMGIYASAFPLTIAKPPLEDGRSKDFFSALFSK
jgi:hypothetical protein